MIVTCVYIYVKAGYIDDFKQATIENHQQSVQEPGNLRFDLLCDAQDKQRFMIYEAYESEEAAAAHKNTLHYLKWRDTVADWMAEPRKGIKYNIVTPTDKLEW
jgi:autoinducer 2-degrading protein